jgi:hypothetical protein
VSTISIPSATCVEMARLLGARDEARLLGDTALTNGGDTLCSCVRAATLGSSGKIGRNPDLLPSSARKSSSSSSSNASSATLVLLPRPCSPIAFLLKGAICGALSARRCETPKASGIALPILLCIRVLAAANPLCGSISSLPNGPSAASRSSSGLVTVSSQSSRLVARGR